MKREGRQHGMVRTQTLISPPLNPRPVAGRIINEMKSPPTAGLFTKVSTKPTNHSKFTGKCERPRCNGCHLHPVRKSKDKSKGGQKLRSSDAKLNYKVVTWHVMAGGSNDNKLPLVAADGYSASRFLDDLTSDRHDDDDDDYDVDGDDVVDDEGRPALNLTGYGDDVNVMINNGDDVDGAVDDEGWPALNLTGYVDDVMVSDGDEGYINGFYDVALVWDSVDDDHGWSVVGIE